MSVFNHVTKENNRQAENVSDHENLIQSSSNVIDSSQKEMQQLLSKENQDEKDIKPVRSDVL